MNKELNNVKNELQNYKNDVEFYKTEISTLQVKYFKLVIENSIFLMRLKEFIRLIRVNSPATSGFFQNVENDEILRYENKIIEIPLR